MMAMDRIFGAFQSPADWVVKWIQGWDWGDGRDEKRITSERALTYAPIWYGVNKIAGHLAQLPIYVYKSMDRGAELQLKHPVYRLLRRPNPYQTSVVFREMLGVHSILDGNGRAAIVRRGNRIVELLPLHPERTVTVMIRGVKVHGTRPSPDDRVRLFFDNIEGDDAEDGLILLDDEDVLHVPGLTMNGVTGVPLRDIASRNIGASINAEKRLAFQMDKGFSGSLMLEAPQGVFRKQEEAEEFLEAFEKRHNSPEKAGRAGLLREGMKANVLSMNNRDAEMIENRKFQRQDAALYLGLESILGDDQSVSYNSLSEKNRGYLMNCLNRWLVRYEQEIEFKLLSRREFDAASHYVRYDTSDLIRSDFVSTVDALTKAVSGMIFTTNEAREVLDMNPVEGGDVLRNPAITPGTSQDQQLSEPEDDTPDTSDAATMAHVSHLIGVEANRVRQAAVKQKNFMQWASQFYSCDNFERKLADNLELLGLDRHLATLHCDESKRQLLEICTNSPVESVADAVAERVAGWKSRAAIILGDTANV